MDQKNTSPSHSLPLGIALITFAFFCSAVMSAFGKAVSDVPPLLTLLLQYAISFACFLPTAARQGPAALETRHLGLHIFRSLAGSICQLLFFISVKSIPLMDSVLLTNAAPLFIPIVIYVWMKKTVQPLVWVSLFIGLIGIVLIIKPGPQMFQNPGSLIALAGGFFSALALVATNKLSDSEPPNRILVYNFGISTLLLIPVSFSSWKPLSGRDWGLLVAIGIFYALTQYFIIQAYRHATAAELSPFNYTVVVFSGLLGWLVFGTVPTTAAIFGTVLICAGGILSIQSGHAEGKGHAIGTGHWWKFDWQFHRHRRAAAV